MSETLNHSLFWFVQNTDSFKIMFFRADIQNNNALARTICLNIGFNIQKDSVNVFQPVCANVYACVFSMSYHLFNQANEWQPSMRRGGLIKAFPGTGDVQRKQQGREREIEKEKRRETGEGEGPRIRNQVPVGWSRCRLRARPLGPTGQPELKTICIVPSFNLGSSTPHLSLSFSLLLLLNRSVLHKEG